MVDFPYFPLPCLNMFDYWSFNICTPISLSGLNVSWCVCLESPSDADVSKNIRENMAYSENETYETMAKVPKSSSKSQVQ